MSAAAVVAPTAYTITASWFHWLVAIPLLGTVGTVLQAQQAPKEDKGMWMHRHKSLGLLTGMIVAPRLAYRLLNSYAFQVQKVAGVSEAENVAGRVTHYALYAFMLVMPASGIAMGYYGGKGLPFFWTTIPSALAATDESKATYGAIAKNSFNVHKQVGTYGKYLIPVHLTGTFWHFFRGQTIFLRINPFRAPPKM